MLDIKYIHKLLDKDNVFDILRQTVSYFDSELDFDENTFFIELLNLTGYNIWFPEWKRFIDNLIIDTN